MLLFILLMLVVRAVNEDADWTKVLPAMIGSRRNIKLILKHKYLVRGWKKSKHNNKSILSLLCSNCSDCIVCLGIMSGASDVYWSPGDMSWCQDVNEIFLARPWNISPDKCRSLFLQWSSAGSCRAILSFRASHWSADDNPGLWLVNSWVSLTSALKSPNLGLQTASMSGQWAKEMKKMWAWTNQRQNLTLQSMGRKYARTTDINLWQDVDTCKDFKVV